MNVKYRVDYTEILSGNRTVKQCDLVHGPIENVQDHLDERSWILESVTVIEYVGSDASGRIVPEAEWLLY